MTLTAEPVFNRDAVLEMVDGEVDFVCELVEIFLNDFNSQVDAVQTGISSGNADLVQKTCHRLKTSVGNLGGDRARPVIVELEQLARTGTVEGAEALIGQFLSELKGFEMELRRFLRDSQPA